MTTDQIQAGVRAAVAVGQSIKELGSIPEGVLYAQLMGHMDLSAFESLIRLLVRTGVVERDVNHILRYVGN
jgi:hypothetical protein